MPSARRRSLQKQNSKGSVGKTQRPDREVPAYCHTNVTPTRSREYIKLSAGSPKPPRPRSTIIGEMALGFSDKHVVIGKVEEYNRRIQLPTFHIKGNFTNDDDVEYEGALRFYLVHGDNNFTKAVRLTSSTTWKNLKPTLLEKFNLTSEIQKGGLVPILYAVRENGESSVRDEDCPLVMALDSCAHIDFVLRVYQQGSDQSVAMDSKSKNQSNKFFAAMRKKLNKGKSEKNLLKNGPVTTVATKSATLSRDPVSPLANKQNKPKRLASDASKKSGDSSRKSSRDVTSTLASSAAANAHSMENLSKVGKTLKKKSKKSGVRTMSNSMSNMLSIDDAEEFITIHGDRSELGVDEVVIPIDGSMTVRDIITDVLEECEVSLARNDDFCLCDVIGREMEGIWLTDYARDMNDSEKPLLLISMMKPSEGLSRRFELKPVSRDDDTASHGTSVLGENISFGLHKRHVSTSLSSISNVTDYNQQQMKFPTDTPYFLTVQSYDPRHDSVIHPITRSTSIIGSSEDEDKCNIRLYAADIQPQHCWICKVYDSEDDTEYKCVSLAPFPGASVSINDVAITCKTNIKPGDVVTLGSHYIFLFKDPTRADSERTNSHSLARHTSNEGAHHMFGADQAWRDIEHGAMNIQFSADKNQEVLEKIIHIMSPRDEGFKLTPCYLLALMLENARVVMNKISLGDFLVKMANEVQNTVWESTKSLQGNTHDADSDNPVECLHVVAPNLQIVLFWMSNCIELRSHILEERWHLAQSLPAESMAQASSVLSDAITYAFQQAVYHLTKVLYPTLDLILTNNPFSQSHESVCMTDTLTALTMITEMCAEMSLNADITSQLFAYLYFFIGTSLCNKMFENDSTTVFYNWEEGVKVRKNLELLETWAHDSHMAYATNYLSKAISIAEFLATSKQFLLQASWHQLRNLYPKLTASQLRHLLDNYDLGSRPAPTQWCPPSDEIHAIMEEGVLESFEDHPPLNMPLHSALDLHMPLEDKTFHQCLDWINSTFGGHQSEDETDSGFDLEHSRSPTEIDESSGKSFTNLKSDYNSSNDESKTYTPIFTKKKDAPTLQKPGQVPEQLFESDTDDAAEHINNMTLTPDHREDGLRRNLV